ncbi:uncharacterized protein LOC144615029 [Panthera onca]
MRLYLWIPGLRCSVYNRWFLNKREKAVPDRKLKSKEVLRSSNNVQQRGSWSAHLTSKGSRSCHSKVSPGGRDFIREIMWFCEFCFFQQLKIEKHSGLSWPFQTRTCPDIQASKSRL